jgi:hypothetical protein
LDRGLKRELHRKVVRKAGQGNVEARSLLRVAELQVMLHEAGCPRCVGPVLIHCDGVVECLSGCEGDAYWHSDDDVWPCLYGRKQFPAAIVFVHVCARCDFVPPEDTPWKVVEG